MSNPLTRDRFSTDEEYTEYQQRMQEMEASELRYNIQMLEGIRASKRETPCQTFKMRKRNIPLSVFIKVYPFNELVDCGLGFTLDELMELQRLYSTLDEGDQQLYIDSLRRLEEMILRIESNRIPGSYGKGFRSWKDQVAANQEVQNILLNLEEPPQEEIDKIAGEYYMKDRIPSPSISQPLPLPQSQPRTFRERVKSLFGFNGGRRTMKKMYKKRSKSRSKKSQYKKSKSRSRSRSKK